MSTPRPIPSPAGFTLVEMLATLAVVGVIAAVTSPIVVNASQAFAKSASQRRAVEQVAGALDRLTRALREAPAKASPPGATNFTYAAANAFTLSNGVQVEMDASTLTYGIATVKPVPLCPNVTAFQLTYLDASGAAVNVASGTDSVRRVIIRLAAQGVELTATVWLRSSLNES